MKRPNEHSLLVAERTTKTQVMTCKGCKIEDQSASMCHFSLLSKPEAWLKGDLPALNVALENGIISAPEFAATIAPLLREISGMFRPLLAHLDAHVGEDHLRAARRRTLLPDGKDIFNEAVDLRFGEIRSGLRQHACIGGKLLAIGPDGERIIEARVHFLRAKPLVTSDQLVLQLALLIRHR